jgi:hypothetical protein
MVLGVLTFHLLYHTHIYYLTFHLLYHTHVYDLICASHNAECRSSETVYETTLLYTKGTL